MRSSASSFCFQYHFFSLISSSKCLCLLPRLPVTSTLPSIYPSITCFRRQFLCKKRPIQSAFLLPIVYKILPFSFTLCNTPSFLTRSIQLISSILLQHHISKLSRYSWSTFLTVQLLAPIKAVLKLDQFSSFFLNFQSNLLVKRVFWAEVEFRENEQK